MGKRLLPYVRVSKQGLREGEKFLSPDLQMGSLETYRARGGHTFVLAPNGKPYRDIDKSGTTSDKRHIRAMIDRVGRGEADGVLVVRVDRWGRNLGDSLVNINALREAGGEIHSATENLDNLDTPIGEFNLQLLLAFAALFSKQMSVSWKSVHQHRVETKGTTAHGTARWGYRREGAEYVPDRPGTAELLADAYRQRIAGVRFHTLAARLNEAGYRTTRGNAWTPNTLRNALDSGFGAGLLCTKVPKGGVGGPEARTFAPGKHEPVISEEEWEFYKAARKAVVPPRAAAPARRLAGMVYCGACNTKMLVRTQMTPRRGDQPGRSYRAFTCRSRNGNAGFANPQQCDNPGHLQEAVLELLVQEWLRAHVTEEATFETEQRRTAAAARATRNMEDVDREIGALKREQVKFAMNATRQNWDEETIAGVQEEFSERMTALVRAKQAALQAKEVNTVPSRDMYEAILAGFEYGMPTDVMNPALRKAIGKIVVSRDPAHPRKPAVTIVPTWEMSLSSVTEGVLDDEEAA